MNTIQNIAVIGGGAAGFFSAISAAQHHPEASIQILEASMKFLSKVRISGGGRCNVTHDCHEISKLVKHYPRGEKFLKSVFREFQVKDTIDWFESRSVSLKAEEDGRLFPISDDSSSIVFALTDEAKKLGVTLNLGTRVKEIRSKEGSFELLLGDEQSLQFDRVIIASGGSPKLSGLKWLSDLGHKIEAPVPSLFTFNMPEENIVELMGVTVPEVELRVEGEKLRSSGPLLITHWGMSGPAVLKASAFGARLFAAKNYQFAIRLNWTGAESEGVLRAEVIELLSASPKKKIGNIKIGLLPTRLWHYLIERSGLSGDELCGELSKKQKNRLVDVLYNDRYEVQGKTTFKEEFVTCGGVSLKDINPKTMQSRIHPGLYFAGEVLDIDGVTGGFNFQAAWSTGYVAGILT